ncbi:hypothetical protein [Sorangium sp. So ce1182]|uniref:hypothetical protein n=1 Tax=Sorangium sp. So ce1182 TaxID=3133334 RepID=UPI003F602D7B
MPSSHLTTYRRNSVARVLATLSVVALGAACSPEEGRHGGDDAGEGGGGAGGSGAGAGGGAPQRARFQWAVQIGESGVDSAVSVTVDPEGNPIVIGRFSGTIDLGGGPLVAQGGSASYLAKFDRDGKHLWSKAFPLNLSGGQHIAHNRRNGLYVGGSYSGNLDLGGRPLPELNGGVAIALLDSGSGKHLWSLGFGDEYEKDLSYVALDTASSLFVSGSMRGTADFGGGPIGDTLVGSGFYLTKWDGEGTHFFTKYIDDGRASLAAGGLAISARGNVVIAGTFEQSFTVVPEDRAKMPLASKGGRDIFFAMLDPDRTLRWQQAFGDSLDDSASQVAVDGEGNVLLAGTFQGSVAFGGDPLVALGTNPNFFVAKFNVEGVNLYSRGFGDSDMQDAASVAVDPAGNAVVTGTFRGSIDLDGAVLSSQGTAPDASGHLAGGDVFIAKLGPDGKHLWSLRAGDPDMQEAGGVAVGPGGEVFAVGSFRGTVDFGGGPMVARGQADGYLVKLGP